MNSPWTNFAALRLEGMLKALKEQLQVPRFQDLSREERFKLLVDAELGFRSERRLANRIKKAALRQNVRLDQIDH